MALPTDTSSNLRLDVERVLGRSFRQVELLYKAFESAHKDLKTGIHYDGNRAQSLGADSTMRSCMLHARALGRPPQNCMQPLATQALADPTTGQIYVQLINKQVLGEIAAASGLDQWIVCSPCQQQPLPPRVVTYAMRAFLVAIERDCAGDYDAVRSSMHALMCYSETTAAFGIPPAAGVFDSALTSSSATDNSAALSSSRDVSARGQRLQQAQRVIRNYVQHELEKAERDGMTSRHLHSFGSDSRFSPVLWKLYYGCTSSYTVTILQDSVQLLRDEINLNIISSPETDDWFTLHLAD